MWYWWSGRSITHYLWLVKVCPLSITSVRRCNYLDRSVIQGKLFKSLCFVSAAAVGATVANVRKQTTWRERKRKGTNTNSQAVDLTRTWQVKQLFSFVWIIKRLFWKISFPVQLQDFFLGLFSKSIFAKEILLCSMFVHLLFFFPQHFSLVTKYLVT